MTAPSTPRLAATLILVRDTDDAIETLLLRRSANVTFVPGAHVFPGGAVDERDHDSTHDPHVVGHDDASASLLQQVPDGGRALFIAAVRECLEEAGVAIATSGGELVTSSHPLFDDLATLREQLEAGTRTLPDIAEEFDVLFDLEPVRYLSRWITPESSPRRYDARFFVAEMPPDQEASADEWEAVEATWWTPAAALAAARSGELLLIEPTVRSLELLDRFTTTDALLTALDFGQGRPDRIREAGGGERVAIPDDVPIVDAGDPR